MIASFGLVIVIIIFHELWCVAGRLRIHHGAGISAGAIIFRTLGIELLTHFITGVRIVGSIEITVRRTTADIVHGGGHGCLDTRIVGCRIDGKTSPATDADDADTPGIHIRTRRQVIHCCRKVFGIDVRRSHTARLSATLTCKRGVESNREETPFGKCLSIQPRRLFLHGTERTADSDSRQFSPGGRFRYIQVGSERDAVTVDKGYFAVVHLIALRERFVPFLGQFQFFHIPVTLSVLCRAFRQTGEAEESGR